MTREEQRDMACTNWICSQENGKVIKAREVWRAAVEWADQHPQWIPVEERLPEEVSEIHHCSTDVLIGYFADGDNYQTTARYNCKEKVWYDANDWGEIDIPTHWMLLPQPPRKEE